MVHKYIHISNLTKFVIQEIEPFTFPLLLQREWEIREKQKLGNMVTFKAWEIYSFHHCYSMVLGYLSIQFRSQMLIMYILLHGINLADK